MDMTASQFLAALSEIMVINILLSGDNAVVIALAARALPETQRRWAIIGGTFGAVVLRIIFAAVIVVLLRIPYLKLVGGALLLWIAIKLLVPGDGDGTDDKPAQKAMWGAIGTIVMADAVMSLDNVIGVAAAAKDNLLLMSIGLAISIPICVFGATIVLKLLTRFPILVTAGCGLLGWVAGDVGLSDAAVGEFTGQVEKYWHYVVPAACAALVVMAGHALAHHQARRRKVLDIAE